MTPQEIIDKVTARLRDGTGRAYNYALDQCTYLSPDTGKQCAVGIFLTDPVTVLHEGDVAQMCEDRFKDDPIIGDLIWPNLPLFKRLQGAHDYHAHWSGRTFNEDGELHLMLVCDDFGLIYREPEAK